MKIEKYNLQNFEDIKQIKDGIEFWFARDLQKLLEYREWRNFEKVIEKARLSITKTELDFDEHIIAVEREIKLGNGGTRRVSDYILTRYACYLIVQNGDPKKEIIALGQKYFAIQTRKQELEEFKELSEDDRRIELRDNVKGFNKKLAQAAKDSGVKHYPSFQNAGYKGLYNGETAKDIKERKGLDKKEQILDHMGSTELAANFFRITQTEERLKKGDIYGQTEASDTHYKIGKKVRDTMEEISGVLPEELPTPEKSVKRLIQERKKK